MSRNGSVEGSKPKQTSEYQNTTITEEEGEANEEERYYESLDRIASSSCSCSASNSDSDPELSEDQITNLPLLSSRFCKGYDMWISEPASVTERRQLLLLQMGLIGCSKLLGYRRLFSCDHLSCRYRRGESSEIRDLSPNSTEVSTSSGGVIWPELTTADGVSLRSSANFTSCARSSSSTNVPILHVNSCDGQLLKHIGNDHDAVENDSQPEVVPLLKPPLGKLGKRDNHLRKSGEAGASQVCGIKDLDNGKEFVVNEVNKLREVETGRQLTMEEFEICVGHSPIVKELMRRQNVVEVSTTGKLRSKKKVRSWFSTFKRKGNKERSSDERDTGSEKQGRRSSSATDDSQDVSFHGSERVKVKQYGKTFKELSAVIKSQEIQAHSGSIWSIKFSLDGRYLASAGEDGVIHVWQVVEAERRGDDRIFNLPLLQNGSPKQKSLSLEHIFVPETVFALSDKPVCSFHGHHHDVLDLSWSKSQHLLSSSMDKTVRLWHLSSNSCLKIFSHSDYVTCIHFNPVDDIYFISGSLDSKVRIWSIPDRQVVDWTDLREMVTAACYTPDGQGALVGSYKGSCRLYNTSENKLHVKRHINLQNKKKKITGFQFAPRSSSEVFISSADSRVRVVDGIDVAHKFKGFRNTNSQISASVTSNGRYVVAASEDSSVYIWKHEIDSRLGRTKGVTVTRSCEHFHSHDVSVAIPWPGFSQPSRPKSPTGTAAARKGTNPSSNGYFFDRTSATWPEEKLQHPKIDTPHGVNSAHGMVIITAGLRGEIRTFQNFGFPVRI